MDRSVQHVHLRTAALESKTTVTAKEAGLVRTKRKRAYQEGNIPEMVARVQSLKELQEAVKAIASVRGTMSRRAVRRAQAAVDARRAELEARLITAPGDANERRERRTEGGLYLP